MLFYYKSNQYFWPSTPPKKLASVFYNIGAIMTISVARTKHIDTHVCDHSYNEIIFLPASDNANKTLLLAINRCVFLLIEILDRSAPNCIMPFLEILIV